MKRIGVLILTVMVILSFAIPAMAYTTNAPTTGSAYKLDIYMVEYEGSDSALMGLISQKPQNRAYVKNEIVAAVGAITVPSRSDVLADGYNALQFEAKNLTFNVTDNTPHTSSGGSRVVSLVHTVPSAGWTHDGWVLDSDDSVIKVALTAAGVNSPNYIPVVSAKKTYRFLTFGKITKDNASITFSLCSATKFLQALPVGAGWTTAFAANPNTPGITQTNITDYLRLNEDLVVYKLAGGNYIVTEDSGTLGAGGEPSNARVQILFRIEKLASNKTGRLYMYPSGINGPVYRVHVEPSSKELVFICVGTSVKNKQDGDQIKLNEKGYKALRLFYDDYFEKQLELSAYREGNVMTDKDWETFASTQNVSARVDLTPYYNYPTR